MFTYCVNNPVINIDPVGSCKVNYALKSGKEDCGNPNCFMSSKFNTFSIYLVKVQMMILVLLYMIIIGMIVKMIFMNKY